MDGFYQGDDATIVARRKARYGHRSWIVWKDKKGQKFAARCTPEAVKAAMLACGTQGKFVREYADGTGMVVSWSLGAMWLKSAKSGWLYQFE